MGRGLYGRSDASALNAARGHIAPRARRPRALPLERGHGSTHCAPALRAVRSSCAPPLRVESAALARARHVRVLHPLDAARAPHAAARAPLVARVRRRVFA